VREVEAIARRTRPFEIRFGTIGTFEAPIGVHVNLEPNAALVDLYVQLKSALDQLGLATYPYDADSWLPHLTLSCGHWSPRDLGFISEMFSRLTASFTAERIQVNLLDSEDGSGRWITLRDLALTGEVALSDEQAA